MNEFVYHQLINEKYIGIVTILDYEISIRKCLSNFQISTENRKEYIVLIDLALKVGVGKYRFITFKIADDGHILWNSSKYVSPENEIEILANHYIQQKADILPYSILSSSAKKSIFT